MRIFEEQDEPVPEGWRRRQKSVTVGLPANLTDETSEAAKALVKAEFEDKFPPPAWEFKECFALRSWQHRGINKVTYGVICLEKLPEPPKKSYV